MWGVYGCGVSVWVVCCEFWGAYVPGAWCVCVCRDMYVWSMYVYMCVHVCMSGVCVYMHVCASVNHSACVEVRGTWFSPSTAGSWVPVQDVRLMQQRRFALSHHDSRHLLFFYMLFTSFSSGYTLLALPWISVYISTLHFCFSSSFRAC